MGLLDAIKSKVKVLKNNRNKKKTKPYVKMEKSSSAKFDIVKRKTRRLIDDTLKAADHPGKTPISS